MYTLGSVGSGLNTPKNLTEDLMPTLNTQHFLLHNATNTLFSKGIEERYPAPPY